MTVPDQEAPANYVPATRGNTVGGKCYPELLGVKGA